MIRTMATGFLPNVIIAGAPKAGTSSLHTWLSDHPNALGSNPKETYYFVDPGTHMYRPDRHITNGLDGYRTYFRALRDAAPCVVLEATPAYLYYHTALEHLPDLETAPTFLFVVREPASQIYSLFTYFKHNWTWIPRDMTFSNYLCAVRSGGMDFMGNELARNALHYAVYLDYLERWRERLGTERMKVRLFDDLLADQRAFTKEIAGWLGLDPTFYDSYGFPRDNETYTVQAAWLQWINIALRSHLPKGAVYNRLRAVYRSINTRKPRGPDAADRKVLNALRTEFAPANQRLGEAFGLDLSAWTLPAENDGLDYGKRHKT